MDVWQFSLRPVLARFADGGLFRTVIGNVVRVAAVLLVLGGLALWAGVWSLIGDAKFFAGLGLVIFQIVALVALVAVGHVVFVRGTDITRLPETEFPLAPIFATLVRLQGEVAIVFFGVLSVPAMLLMWFGASHLAGQIPMVPGMAGGGFLAGIGIFLIFWAYGFLALIVTYFLAELITVLFAMAADMRGTREAVQRSA